MCFGTSQMQRFAQAFLFPKLPHAYLPVYRIGTIGDKRPLQRSLISKQEKMILKDLTRQKSSRGVSWPLRQMLAR